MWSLLHFTLQKVCFFLGGEGITSWDRGFAVGSDKDIARIRSGQPPRAQRSHVTKASFRPKVRLAPVSTYRCPAVWP